VKKSFRVSWNPSKKKLMQQLAMLVSRLAVAQSGGDLGFHTVPGM
jgi:hypothetical protein